MEETHVHALDYLNVFRRRKWWLIAPILLSIVAGAVLVKVLPKEYRAEATIGVQASAVSPSFMNPSALLDNQERMRALSQQLLSVPMLSRVVREEGLGPGGADDPEIWKLHRAIEVSVPEPVASVGERRLDTFVVSYGDADPARAQRIANRLVNVFVDENSRARATRAENTSAFIQAQLQQSQARLDDLEARLRIAKESHMGQLPEQMQANLQNLSGLRQQLESNATALRGEQDRLSMIERQLEDMRQGTANVLLLPRGSDPVSVHSPELQVLVVQQELDTARAMYTDKHPEIQRLEDELARARRDAEADRQRPAEDRLDQLKLDPTYRQLTADREMARLRIRDLQRADDDTRRQIRVYQERVERAPGVEQQLASLEREYTLEREQYSGLSENLHAATIAENVERNGRGEQFAVLYAAARPLTPDKPIPWRVMLVSVLMGIFVGAGATLGREYLDRSVHDVHDLRDEFELPVLGEVGRINAA